MLGVEALNVKVCVDSENITIEENIPVTCSGFSIYFITTKS